KNMRKEQNSRETREHILEVARRQFFKKGFSGASINTIVDASNVSKPTVYYHFKSKAGLFAALVEDAFERCFERRRISVRAEASLAEQIYQIIAADFAFCLESPELVHFVLALTF